MRSVTFTEISKLKGFSITIMVLKQTNKWLKMQNNALKLFVNVLIVVFKVILFFKVEFHGFRYSCLRCILLAKKVLLSFVHPHGWNSAYNEIILHKKMKLL